MTEGMRKIPVAVIAALALQTAGALVWAGGAAVAGAVVWAPSGKAAASSSQAAKFRRRFFMVGFKNRRRTAAA